MAISTGLGIGALSSFGVATQVSPGTPQSSPEVFVPFLSESISSNRNSIPSGSIVGDSMVQGVAPGVVTLEGGIQAEMDGQVSGQLIWLWNGEAGYTATQFGASMGIITAAPTGAAVTGTGLSTGAYLYKVSPVILRTDGHRIVMPSSPESATITTSAGSLKVNISWSNPTGYPAGSTHYGTIVWRTLVGGAAASEVFCAFVSGSATTYADTTPDLSLGTSIPYSANLYFHNMIGSPPTNGDRLTSFTAFVNKNNDQAEQYWDCKMDQMKISVSGMGERMMLDFSLKGTQAQLINNFTPTFTPLAPFAGWSAYLLIDGANDATVESFEIQCSNGVNPVPGLAAIPFNRDTISGKREVKLQFTRQFFNHEFWSLMMAGQQFSMVISSAGDSVANPITCGVLAAESGDTGNGSQFGMMPWQYYCTIELFRLIIDKSGAPVNGPDREIETVTATAFKDSGAETEMRIRLYNSIPAYV